MAASNVLTSPFSNLVLALACGLVAAFIPVIKP